MSLLTQIADAVKAKLDAAGSLSLPFVSERLYVPVHELEQLDTLVVSVVPAGTTSELLARNGVASNDYVIDVGTQKRIPVDPTHPGIRNTDLDPLMNFVEAIGDLFLGTTLATTPPARCVQASNQPIFVPEHLDEKRVFTSVISLTFRLVK